MLDKLYVVYHDLTCFARVDVRDSDSRIKSVSAPVSLLLLQLKRKIMGELNFSQDYFDKDTMLLSAFGISNLRHQFWPLLYGIVQGENNNFWQKYVGYWRTINEQRKVENDICSF